MFWQFCVQYENPLFYVEVVCGGLFVVEPLTLCACWRGPARLERPCQAGRRWWLQVHFLRHMARERNTIDGIERDRIWLGIDQMDSLGAGYASVFGEDMEERLAAAGMAIAGQRCTQPATPGLTSSVVTNVYWRPGEPGFSPVRAAVWRSPVP